MRKVSVYTVTTLILLFISFLMAGASSTVGSNLSARRMENAIRVESAGAPAVEWNMTYGTTRITQGGNSVVQTRDGGFAVAGYTYSFGAGSEDAWLIKLAGSGPRTWTVDDDGPADFSTIQEAINAANSGDRIFVRNGTYYEHVCVNTTVSIAGQDRDTTTIDGNQTGTVVTVTADNVNISGFTVQNGEAGLDLAGDGNTVTSSIFSSNGALEMDLKADLEVYQDPWQPLAWHYPIGLMNGSYTEVIELTTETPVLSVEAFGHSDVESLMLGIFYDENMDGAPQLHEFIGFGCLDKNPWTCLFGPPKGQYIIKIKGEEVTGNPGHFDRKITRYKGYGIGAHSCLNNTLSENLISGNYAGLYVQSSSGMVVHSNNVTKNIGGIVTENMTNSIFCSNRVFANTPNDTYSTGISIRAAENVNLSSNVVSNNAFGINIWNSTNTNIENNEIYSHSGWAVELHASYGNKVANNCISNVSALDGIRLMFSSGNSLTGNNITACEHSGILLWHDCDNNTATSNNIQLSGSLGVIPGHGVEILLSHNNTFSNNVFSHGSNQGLVAIESSDNTVAANLVSSNRKGIVLRDSIRNRVYHNSIIDNWEQQGFDDTGENTWDDGYPSGGNYWSDYIGTDLHSSPYQNETGSDGMGDTPYVIDANNEDSYPLMRPYVPFENQTIYIRTDGSIDPSGAPVLRQGNIYTMTSSITSNADGIVIEKDNIVVDGTDHTIQGTASGYGIFLSGRSNVTIKNAKISGFDKGIGLSSFSNNNSIFGNNITANGVFGYGVLLYGSSSNSISGCNISNNYYGIGLYESSSNNSVSCNDITSNGHGIWLDYSSSNSISGNKVTANYYLGIALHESSSNKIYHNCFVNNASQVYSQNSVNVWDNGCEGNYWSDYFGNDSNNDGIGDTPYIIDSDNTDNYPLMNIYWSPCDINHDLKVDMKDIGKSARAFGTVPGDAWWNPHADITGPQYLVPDGKIDMRDIGLVAMHFGEHL